MPDREELGAKLAGVVGEEYVLGAEAAAGLAVDGVAPRLAVRPGSQQEVEALVAACAAAGAAMVPWGGGTSAGLGNPPRRSDVAVSLDRLGRIVEFDGANLSVTAEAGVTLGRLQEVLREKREFLPLDPPRPEHVTVGGLVQSNGTGPSRLLYGTVRDWVLGLRVVLPNGDRIRCGGKVIKNVSGYDLNKLFIGTFGTMGIVTEATFKLLPLPAARATVLGVFRSAADLGAVVARTRESFLLPEALEALNAPALAAVAAALGVALPPGYGLAVSLAGSPENVRREVTDFEAFFAEGRAVATEALTEAAAAAGWCAIRDLHARPDGGSAARVVAKIAVPVGVTLDFFAGAGEAFAPFGSPRVTAHAGSGIVRAATTLDAGADLSQLRGVLAELRGRAETADGSLVLEEAPAPLKRAVDVWGAPRGDVAVMRALKRQFDPDALLNPGRFVGGI